MSITIGLIAGEASGDALGAGLIEGLRRRYPQARFVGVAGPRMQALGCEAWVESEELAVMGLVEVLKHLPRLLRLRRRLVKRLFSVRPDVVVGIDAPDFCLGVEKRLRRHGIATAHYVSPSIWAWRPGRIKTIEQAADLVLCLLPFEPACYQGSRCEAKFVGHPLADRLAPVPDRGQVKRRLGLNDQQPVVALLPGSRGGEVARHAALFSRAVMQLQQRIGPMQLLIPAASEQRLQQLEHVFANAPEGVTVHLAQDQAEAFLSCADVALVASGTATLETMLLDTPMVVTYRLAPLTAWLFRHFGGLQTRFFSLPNLIAGQQIVPELLQQDATPAALADALQGLLDGPAATNQRRAFAAQHRVLKQDANHQAAEAVSKLLEQASGRA
jgi:lipid-A-disaccharide synthase